MIFNPYCLATVLLAAPTTAIFPPRNTKNVKNMERDKKVKGVFHESKSITSRKLQSSLPYIVLGNYDQNQFLMNDGSGGFTTALDLPGSGYLYTRSVATADLNGDGYADVVVGNNGSDNEVLINDGSGGFSTTALTLPGGAQVTLSVSTADLNNDGYADIIVGNDGQDNQVLMNNGSGGFTTAALNLPGGAESTTSVATADLNGDGYPDIIVGNYGQDNQVLMNDGSGGFTTAALNLPGGAESTYTRSVATADVNGDGYPDIIVGNHFQDNQVLMNDGSGGFTTALTLPRPGEEFTQTYGISAADLNGDGYDDIVVGNNGSDNEVLMNDGSGGFTTALTLPGGALLTRSVATADLNGDGYADIVVGNNGQNQVLVNDGSGGFPTALNLPGGALDTKSIALVHSQPQAGPWDITFDASTGLDSDFSATSNKELTFTYSIGKDRPYNAPTLLQEDCESAITDVIITQATPVRTPDDASYDTLTMEYDIDKSSIGGSAIYDANTSKLKVCQVLQLIDSGMVIYEDKHLTIITFDLDVDFTTEDQDLGAEADATVVTGAAGVDSYVEAYKCGAGDMTENASALDPNTDLYVCVRSTSADVEIDSLDEMDITGTDSNGQQSSLEVIDLGQPKYTAFTSVETISATERRVKTRVSASNFDYNGNGQAISIIGSVTMKLTGSGRKLGTNLFEGSGSTDHFEFVVGLQPKKDEEDASAKMKEMNSSPNTKSVELSIAVAILAFANAIW